MATFKERLQAVDTSMDKILQEDIQALVTQGQTPPQNLKLSEVANYITKIITKGATIIVTALDFEGQILTATKGNKNFTGTVKSGTCEITVDESGTWIVSAVSGQSVEVSVSVGVPCTLKKGKIFTYVVNQIESDPDKRVTYRDDAIGMTPAKMNFSTGNFEYGDWENEFIIKENHVWALDSSGNRYKQCKDNDYSQFTDGTSSGYNTTSSPYNFMASFPTCWIWRRMEGNNRVVSIADYKVDSNYHAYGWESETGNVQKYMYLAAFNGSDISTKLRSLGGQPVMVSKDADTERSYAEKNGTGWTTLDFCKWQAYIDLLVLISKSTNTQGSFGYGYANLNSTALQTGILYNKGQFWGESTGSQAVKVFHVENPWGNVYNRCAGFVIKTDGRCYVKTHKPYNSDGSGYTMISDIPEISTDIIGYLSAGISTEYGFVATAAASGSETTYECDYGYYFKPKSGVYYSQVGGNWNDKGRAGAFYFHCFYPPSTNNTYIGASLSYTPQENTGITT